MITVTRAPDTSLSLCERGESLEMIVTVIGNCDRTPLPLPGGLGASPHLHNLHEHGLRRPKNDMNTWALFRRMYILSHAPRFKLIVPRTCTKAPAAFGAGSPSSHLHLLLCRCPICSVLAFLRYSVYGLPYDHGSTHIRLFRGIRLDGSVVQVRRLFRSGALKAAERRGITPVTLFESTSHLFK